jgi:hypothetical protein
MGDKILQEISPDKYFWARDGTVIKNLRELYGALLRMDKGTFSHHANKERNDFYNWVKDVFNDKGLANSLLKAKTPRGAARCVKKKIGGAGKLKKKIIKTRKIKSQDKKSRPSILKKIKEAYHG